MLGYKYYYLCWKILKGSIYQAASNNNLCEDSEGDSGT